MKHIFYKPKESLYQTIVIYPIKDDGHPKDVAIFHNIIAVNKLFLTLDEFTNSFNDASELDYLEPEYKERVVKAYWKNQKEYPNEDLMHFDGSFSYLDKILIARYSKNEKMLERISTDLNPLIRQELAKCKYLPQHIINKLAQDSDIGVRLNIVPRPLTKEQLKLYVKENDFVVTDNLFDNHRNMFDYELTEYFVKNGSDNMKEAMSNFNFSLIILTKEQIEYLAQPKNSGFRTQGNLIRRYELSENTVISILNFWRRYKLVKRELMGSLVYCYYLTETIVDRIIENNDDLLKLELIENFLLYHHSPSVYQYAILQIFKSDDINFLTKALKKYIRIQEAMHLSLPVELLERLIKINYKKGNLEFADSLLRIQGIPQHFAERIIFDSLTNYKAVNSKEKDKWYYTFGKSTQYSSMIKQMMDYASGLKKFMPPSLSSIFEFRLKV